MRKAKDILKLLQGTVRFIYLFNDDANVQAHSFHNFFLPSMIYIEHKFIFFNWQKWASIDTCDLQSI